jgi:hypothetical protein
MPSYPYTHRVLESRRRPQPRRAVVQVRDVVPVNHRFNMTWHNTTHSHEQIVENTKRGEHARIVHACITRKCIKERLFVRLNRGKGGCCQDTRCPERTRVRIHRRCNILWHEICVLFNRWSYNIDGLIDVHRYGHCEQRVVASVMNVEQWKHARQYTLRWPRITVGLCGPGGPVSDLSYTWL